MSYSDTIMLWNIQHCVFRKENNIAATVAVFLGVREILFFLCKEIALY